MSSNPSLVFTIHKTFSPDKTLEKDANGYYKVLMGALNSYNNVGEFYVAEGIKEIMANKDSLVNKRLTAGYLVGEMGHPQFQPGMTKADYIHRIMQLDQKNTSHHIRSVEFVPGPNGMVKTVGWVKPAGPQGELLRESLDNPDRNTAFSLRAITADYIDKGRTMKKIMEFVTWDWVPMPGIEIANTWQTISTESIDIVEFSPRELDDIIKEIRNTNIGLEDNGVLDTLKSLCHTAKQEENCNHMLNSW